MTSFELELDKKEKSIDWTKDKCDKYDYIIAVSCGALAGLIDVFFVGSAVTKTADLSKLGKLSDSAVDSIVKKVSKAAGWNPRPGKEDNLSSAIAFLEQNYKVPYEHTSTKSVNGLFQMNTKNHHFKSLGHAPDPIGLVFSILDQFSNSATFLNDGKIIRIDASDRGFELQGTNFISKIYCGFCNWLFHLMSDVAGSNGSRAVGSAGRGTGLPIPFMELFSLCNFGRFQIDKDRQTLATLMTRAFQEGYDMRHAGAMAVPVVIEEIMIRAIWTIKRHYYHKKDWSECIPNSKHADLRIMLLVGNGILCVIDGVDAGIKSGGNALIFVLHMNLVAWSRLVVLVLRELKIRYGAKVGQVINGYLAEVGLNDKYAITLYYQRMEQLDLSLNQIFQEFVKQVEEEYKLFVIGANNSLNPQIGTAETRFNNSIAFAESQKIDNKDIVHSNNEILERLKRGRE